MKIIIKLAELEGEEHVPVVDHQGNVIATLNKEVSEVVVDSAFGHIVCLADMAPVHQE